MKDRNKLYFFIGVFISCISFSLEAQITLLLRNDGSLLKVEGTSTIHDWEMEVEEMKGNIIVMQTDKLESLQSGEISFKVNSLVSDHSLMNKKAYSALKENKHPVIKGKVLEIYTENSLSKVKLELDIAGVKRIVTSDYKTSLLNTKQIKVQGEFDLQLSDFDIEPPVAIMGTIKTGDAITITYSFLFGNN